MAGHTKWSEVQGRVPPERRARIDAVKAQMREELALEELRVAMDLTQVDLAKRLKTNQANISKLERRTDMLLSTLSGYVAALGGKLQLTAQFKTGEVRSVRLKGLARSS